MNDTPSNTVPAASTFAQFIQMLEDGDYHAELTTALQNINGALSDHALSFGGKPKGKLTLSVDFTLDNGVFEINADFNTKLPKAPRSRTVAWATQDNRFSPQNPRQMQLFGVRDVAAPSEGASVRSV